MYGCNSSLYICIAAAAVWVSNLSMRCLHLVPDQVDRQPQSFECFASQLRVDSQHHLSPHNMPKEQVRKRGRRKPKEQDEYAKPKVEEAAAEGAGAPVSAEVDAPPQAGPSGLHPDRIALLSGRRPPPAQRQDAAPVLEGQGAEEEQGEQQPWGRQYGLNEEFPFGQLDPDLKGYFRTVEDQIKDWEGTTSAGEQREGVSQAPQSHGLER